MDYIEEYVVKVKKVHSYYTAGRLLLSLVYIAVIMLDVYSTINDITAIIIAAVFTVPVLVLSAYYDSLFRCPVCKGRFKGPGVKKDMFGILPKHCPHCDTPIDKDKPDYNV